MAKLLPLASVEIGDLNIFAPAVPCLFVYTWYEDGEPESAVSYFWQDRSTGAIHHELLVQGPLTYEEAMAWAETHAAKSDIERIHVRHRKTERKARRRKAKTSKASTPARRKAKKRPTVRRRSAKIAKRKR